jgi:hypothetical protein
MTILGDLLERLNELLGDPIGDPDTARRNFGPGSGLRAWRSVTGGEPQETEATVDREALDRAKALFIAAYFDVVGAIPEDEDNERIDNAGTPEEFQDVVIDIVSRVEGGDQIAAAMSRVANGEVKPWGEEDKAVGYTRDANTGKWVQNATGEELTDDQMRAAFPESFGVGATSTSAIEEIINSAPEETALAVNLTLPYIGGLSASQAWGYNAEGVRVPVDPQTGRELTPGEQGAFHQPKGIYTGDDPFNAGRIARGEKVVTPERYIEGGTIPAQTNEPYFPTGDPYLMRNVEHIQRYHPGFEWEPASWDPTEVVKIKDQLVEAQLLRADQRSQGANWSIAEANAFAKVAEAANGTGEMWGFVLGGMAANPPPGTDGRQGPTRVPFVAPAYLAPDMDVLKQAVKESVRGRLGREPTGAEMNALIAGLDQDYRSAYEVQVAAARSEYDATTAAIETEQPQSGGEFRNVDPSASFAERFESRFDNEIDFMKRREALNDRQAYTSATMNMIDNLIGSG